MLVKGRLDMMSGLRAARETLVAFFSLSETRGESASSPGWALKYLRGLPVGGDGGLIPTATSRKDQCVERRRFAFTPINQCR